MNPPREYCGEPEDCPPRGKSLTLVSLLFIRDFLKKCGKRELGSNKNRFIGVFQSFRKKGRASLGMPKLYCQEKVSVLD